jgi:hypothetical protein
MTDTDSKHSKHAAAKKVDAKYSDELGEVNVHKISEEGRAMHTLCATGECMYLVVCVCVCI